MQWQYLRHAIKAQPSPNCSQAWRVFKMLKNYRLVFSPAIMKQVSFKNVKDAYGDWREPYEASVSQCFFSCLFLYQTTLVPRLSSIPTAWARACNRLITIQYLNDFTLRLCLNDREVFLGRTCYYYSQEMKQRFLVKLCTLIFILIKRVPDVFS